MHLDPRETIWTLRCWSHSQACYFAVMSMLNHQKAHKVRSMLVMVAANTTGGIKCMFDIHHIYTMQLHNITIFNYRSWHYNTHRPPPLCISQRGTQSHACHAPYDLLTMAKCFPMQERWPTPKGKYKNGLGLGKRVTITQAFPQEGLTWRSLDQNAMDRKSPDCQSFVACGMPQRLLSMECTNLCREARGYCTSCASTITTSSIDTATPHNHTNTPALTKSEVPGGM